jgi:hypothetical protein
LQSAVSDGTSAGVGEAHDPEKACPGFDPEWAPVSVSIMRGQLGSGPGWWFLACHNGFVPA